MIEVSDAWKNIQYRFLLPETYLELSVGVTDLGVHNLVSVSAVNEAPFSKASQAIENPEEHKPPKYATLEHNLWALDGSRGLFPGGSASEALGYVSKDTSEAKITLTVSEPRDVWIPGFTIKWSTEFDEFPVNFAVTVKKGDTTVDSTYVTGNTSSVSEVALPVKNYDTVIIEAYEWCLPDHRARIDLVSFGHVLTFTKKDIMSFTHEQHGSLNSGEISKNSIEFTLDNTSDRWNPMNPTGLERYLSERQLVNVRYGMDVDGTTEWIKGGSFYLSEWRTPANGLEASFVARDIFEYLINAPYTGPKSGTLLELTQAALKSGNLPESLVTALDPVLGNYSAAFTEDYTAAEVIQMCANASGCVIYQDRDGALYIGPLNKESSNYTITSALSYAHPELTLSKPIRAVSVSYGDELSYRLDVESTGEMQTLDNPLVNTEAQAQRLAQWIWETMKTRKTVSGEFRADPRLDLFDVVSVQSKYGVINPVVITDVKYAYSGSFNATYTGRIYEEENENTAILGKFIMGVSILGKGATA